MTNQLISRTGKSGRLYSVKTILHRGDCVEIGTKGDIAPQREWLQCVHTCKAKLYLNRYFKNLPISEYIRCPHCNPLPLDEVIGFDNGDGAISVHKRDCKEAISRAAQYGDAVRAIDFVEQADCLYPVCIHIKAIDRIHLLGDLINCITNMLKLPIVNLNTQTIDEIVDCDILFKVHSFIELEAVMSDIQKIENVDEVEQIKDNEQ